VGKRLWVGGCRSSSIKKEGKRGPKSGEWRRGAQARKGDSKYDKGQSDALWKHCNVEASGVKNEKNANEIYEKEQTNAKSPNTV